MCNDDIEQIMLAVAWGELAILEEVRRRYVPLHTVTYCAILEEVPPTAPTPIARIDVTDGLKLTTPMAVALRSPSFLSLSGNPLHLPSASAHAQRPPPSPRRARCSSGTRRTITRASPSRSS